MSVVNGRYFEFEIKRDGAKISFVFLPGNNSLDKYKRAVSLVENAFNRLYGVSYKEYFGKVVTNQGFSLPDINEKKILTVLDILLRSEEYKDIQLKVIGENKHGAREEIVVKSPIEINNAKAVVPYFNKNNNDITSRRKK